MIALQLRMVLALLAALGLSTHTTGRAETLTAGSCSRADVQAAIDGASDGQIVDIPAGRCTWGSPVEWANKNIWVRGAGIGQTVIDQGSAHIFYIKGHADGKARFRVSDMTLTGTISASAAITITTENNPGINSGWRVDHIKFDFPYGSQRNGVSVRGVSYGVIDHNEFNWSQGLAIIAAAFHMTDGCTPSNPTGNYISSQPLDLGTANAIYIEDNTFKSNGYPVTAYDTSSGGARAVFRHNTVIGGFYYSHWTRGCEIGGIVHEIYNNVWIGNADYNAYIARLESGTGVVFNNTVNNFGSAPNVVLDDRRAARTESNDGFGNCDGTKAWDGNRGDPDAPGWPCLGQIGRAPGKSLATIIGGSKQVSAPLYFWRNGPENTCTTGGLCTNVLGAFATPAAYIKATPHPNGEVDYILNGNTPKPGYVPFVYPHPIVSGASRPSTPTNLRIVPGI